MQFNLQWLVISESPAWGGASADVLFGNYIIRIVTVYVIQTYNDFQFI